MTFWPTTDHWSVSIPRDTDHYRMPMLAETGFVAMSPLPFTVSPEEWERLEYMDWKSGGDTNFAPLASADGQLDCRGFWDKGKCDKDALWTPNAEHAPTLRDYIAGVVRVYSYDPLWFTVWVGLLLVAARIIVTIFTRGGDWNGPHSTGEE